ncbi:MAG: Uncharacterized MFS-type transporter, partial [uncultured Rubrobacteraceae bacterium]
AEGVERATLLRLGRGRGRVPGAAGLGGGAGRACSAHKPTRRRAGVGTGGHILRRLGWPAHLRPLRAGGRLADGPSQPEENNARRSRPDRGKHPRRRRDDRALAVEPVLGRVERRGHRRRSPRTGCYGRQPLVHRASRSRPRHPRGGGLRRPARLRAGTDVARRRPRLARGDGPARRRRPRRPDPGPLPHARRPVARGPPALRCARRGRGSEDGRGGVARSRAGHGGERPGGDAWRCRLARPAYPGVLAALGELLYLRGVLERHHRGPLRPALHRPRHPGGDGGRRARADGGDELRRHHRLGLAHGPLRPEEASRRLLLPAWPLAPPPAVRHGLRGALYLRDLLWPRLHRHRPSDRRARRRQVRQAQRRGGLRVGILLSPGRRGPGRLPRWRRPRLFRRLHSGVPRRRSSSHTRLPHSLPHKPRPVAPGAGGCPAL